jgi:hypothetical protein
VFYRQSEPYEITVKDSSTNANYQKIILSPSQSKISFLPISKTLFANNEASFTFEDGIPKSAKQDTDGELIALVKIPADIIGAYFAAIGSVFNSFKTNDTAKTDALAANLKLELEQRKYNECKAALAATPKDDAAIKAICN